MLDRIRIVLVRPRRSGNIGSVARAMKNMGLSDLVLVAPRARVGVAASHMAAHADDVLATHRTCSTLAPALAGCTLAIGTVGRAPGPRARLASPRDLAGEIVGAASSGQRVALVFGPEDHGLSNADLELCQRRLCIPTASAYASLNLAQAVLVCAYEVLLCASERGSSKASSNSSSHASRGEGVTARSATAKRATKRGGRRPRDEARRDEMQPATSDEREALLAHLDAALRQVGFLSGPGQKHVMRDVRSLFDRSGLTLRDVRIWRGIARQTLWATARRASQPHSTGDGADIETTPRAAGAKSRAKKAAEKQKRAARSIRGAARSSVSGAARSP